MITEALPKTPIIITLIWPSGGQVRQSHPGRRLTLLPPIPAYPHPPLTMRPPYQHLLSHNLHPTILQHLLEGPPNSNSTRNLPQNLHRRTFPGVLAIFSVLSISRGGWIVMDVLASFSPRSSAPSQIFQGSTSPRASHTLSLPKADGSYGIQDVELDWDTNRVSRPVIPIHALSHSHLYAPTSAEGHG